MLFSWGDKEEGGEEIVVTNKATPIRTKVGGARQKIKTKGSMNKSRMQSRGICRVCGAKRFEAPTEASSLGVHRKVRLPPLGSRRGLSSRRGIDGIGDIREGVSELLQHAAFCVHAPSGHWRRLASKTDVWEEARSQLAGPTEALLAGYGITTIGSLWISMYTNQLASLPGIDPRMAEKLTRLLGFLEAHMAEEIMAPEENEILEDESQLERDVAQAFGKMGAAPELDFGDGMFNIDRESIAFDPAFREDHRELIDQQMLLSGLDSEEFSASGRMLGLPTS